MFRIGDVAIYYIPWLLAILGLSLGLLAYVAFHARHRLWRLPGFVMAMLAPLMMAATWTGLPIVMTNAQLALLPSFQYFAVLRLGVNTVGDAPAQWFIPSSSACSISGGDVGSEVATPDGGCFNAAFPPGPVDVREWGAVGSGSGNYTTQLQAAIDSKIPLWFPPGFTFRFTSTLTETTYNGPHWQGGNNRTSALLCATVSADCIQIGGGSEGAAQVYGATLKDLYIYRDSSVTPTGGNTINLTADAQTTLSRVILDNVCNGIFTDYVDTVTFDQVIITASGSSTCTTYGIFNTASAAAYRSDWIEAIKVNVEMNYAAGSSAWIVKGAVNTGNLTDVNLLNSAKNGFWAQTFSSTSNYPQFWNFKNVQIDGACANGFQVDAGYSWIIDASYIDNNCNTATGVPLLISADVGESNTYVVQIYGSQIFDTPHSGASIDAQDVIFAGNIVHDVGHAATSTYNGLLLGAHTVRAQVYGNELGWVHTDPESPAYGLNISTGAKNVIVGDNDYASGASGLVGTINNNAPPTLSSCGSGTPIVGSSSTDLGGQFVAGTGTVNACTITFPASYTRPPAMVTVTPSINTPLYVSSVTTTGFTVNSASNMAGETIFYRVKF